MIQASWQLILIHGIPESLMFVFNIFVIGNKKLTIKKFTLSCTVFLISIYLIRLLPISLGVNTLLMMVIMVIISFKIIGISFSKSLFPVILSVITIAIGELFNFIILQLIYGNGYASLFKDPLSYCIYTIPSTVFMFIQITIIYIVIRINRNKKMSNGKASAINSK